LTLGAGSPYPRASTRFLERFEDHDVRIRPLLRVLYVSDSPEGEAERRARANMI